MSDPGTWMRRTGAGALVLLLSIVGVDGQSRDRSRIRVSAVDVYEIPGLLKLDGEQVTAASVCTVGRTTVRVPSLAHGTLTVLRPGTRLVGRVIGATSDTMSLAIDGEPEGITIPLDALGRIERGDVEERRRLVRGVLVGVAAFFGTGALVFSQCGLGCDDATFALTAFGGGIAAGVWAGQGRQHWRTLSRTEFVSQFSGISP